MSEHYDKIFYSDIGLDDNYRGEKSTFTGWIEETTDIPSLQYKFYIRAEKVPLNVQLIGYGNSQFCLDQIYIFIKNQNNDYIGYRVDEFNAHYGNGGVYQVDVGEEICFASNGPIKSSENYCTLKITKSNETTSYNTGLVSFRGDIRAFGQGTHTGYRNNYAFYKLFENCGNGLTNIPSNLLTSISSELTTLGTCCCKDMFRGCSSLANAPDIPDLPLAKQCYSNMFYGCSKINKVKVGFSSWRYDNIDDDATTDWLRGVNQNNGQIEITNSDLPYQWGDSRIPETWSVKGIREKCLTFI